MTINTTITDLSHQVHAHGIATQREKGTMTETEYAQIAPHQINSHSQQGIGQILAQQGNGVGGEVQGVALRHGQIQYRYDNRQ